MRFVFQHLSKQQLFELIRGDDLESESGGSRHLDQCSDCRKRMESLAAEPEWWNDQDRLVRSTIEMIDDRRLSDRSLLDVNSTGSQEHELMSIDDSSQLLESASHPELLGRLGQYEVESVLGRGGMGVVFKGFDTELHRTVAIKMLLPHLASNGAARQRFQREARAAAGINHEHVVEIYQVHANEVHPFLVMQYIQGDSLQKIVDRNGPLPSELIAQYAIQIADALAAAHEKSLVHRDIKPANILRQTNGDRLFITDFGLARTIDDANFTCTGLVVGTPHFMSPEQCNGRRTESPTDLFSLGCLLYFLATGRPPFRAETSMGVMNRICHDTHRSVREIKPSISKPLSQAIDRLLEKNPNDRFRSASETARILKQVLAHIQQPAEHAAPRVVAWKRNVRRSFVQKSVLWFLGVSLLAGTAFFLGNVFTDFSFDTRGQQAAEKNDPAAATTSADSETITATDELIRGLRNGTIKADFKQSDDGMSLMLRREPPPKDPSE